MIRLFGQFLVVLGGAALLAFGAGATPLGLQVGDTIDTIEFDAKAVNGDGATYTFLGPPDPKGRLHADGQFTSVDVEAGNPSFPDINQLPLNVTFTFDADLLNYQPLGGTAVNIFFTRSSTTTPDVTVTQGNSLNVILTGNISVPGNLTFTGDITNPTLLAFGNFVITGGKPSLVNALGGLGGSAILSLVATADSFNPNLAILGADGNLVNSNFFVELSGTLTPNNASAFVPEPTTALMLGAGMLGLLAFGRRRGAS